MIINFNYKGMTRIIGVMKLDSEYVQGLDMELLQQALEVLDKEYFDVVVNYFKNYLLYEKEETIEGKTYIRQYLDEFSSPGLDLSKAMKAAYRKFRLSDSNFNPLREKQIENKQAEEKVKMKENIVLSPNFVKKF
jgi:hypothetical protein